MVYNPEKTNAKNLENLHVANGIIASIGAKFNPNNSLLKAAALIDFETNFGDLLEAVNAALPVEQNAVGAQIAAFKPVSKRTTKILKAARGQNLSAEFIGHLTTTGNRLRGVKVTKNTPDNPETTEDENKKNHSASRRSYAGILESLDLLDEQLKSNAGYAPNEEEYKTATISAWVESLRTLHNVALDAKIATRSARSDRDSQIYNNTDGLLVRMKQLKEYAATILDENDSRLKQLNKLTFTKPRQLQ